MLIRRAVDFYLDFDSKSASQKIISNLSYNLKEPLTAIMGNLHLLIENYKDKLDTEILFKLKEIYDKSLIIEQLIYNLQETHITEAQKYDILIVDDDEATNKVLKGYFKLKGYSSKAVISGEQAVVELQKSIPKIIFLDILLPESDGFEICKEIKSNNDFRDTLVYYITAIPRNEVERMMSETKANGYLLKPFDFEKLDDILNLI